MPPGLQNNPQNILWGTLGTKSTPKWPQRACREAPCAPGHPRVPKGAPEGPPKDPQGRQKAPKIVPKTPKGDLAKINRLNCNIT